MKKILLLKAKKLRRQGYSTREISEILFIARSTVSLWVRAEKMTLSGKRRFANLSILAKLKARQKLLDKNEKYGKELESRCRVLKDCRSYKVNDLKIFLALLYWGEGAKSGRTFYFINSDPEMISTYLKLLRSSFEIKEEKLYAWLHLHSYHNRKKMINYWSEITGIDKNRIHIYNKKNSGLRKKQEYKGCISIRYNDYRLFDEVMLVIKRFKELKI